MPVIKKIEPRKQEIIDEVICDICGNSCKVNEYVIDNSIRVDHGETDKEFDYVELKHRWGYYSMHGVDGKSKDGEYWEAAVCGRCIDEHLSKIINFKKYEYHLFNGKVKYNKPINKSSVMETQTQVTETYTAKVECANCMKIYTIDIPKGTKIREEKCHVCGCPTLHAKQDQ